MTKLRITVTKEILERSKNCGIKDSNLIASNCAIALAVRDIWPEASVEEKGIYINEASYRTYPDPADIKLPKSAVEFIKEFDALDMSPERRACLPELTFEIEVPDNVISHINIEELKPLLENHPTLAIVS